MAVDVRLQASPGTSLKSLAKGFVLTQRTEGKSPRTVEYYEGNLRRFIWYADRENWPDDTRLITEWHIREFIGYVASDTGRWALNGNGSESSQRRSSHSTVHHYYAVLKTFFNWCIKESYLSGGIEEIVPEPFLRRSSLFWLCNSCLFTALSVECIV